jgi:hypothetical protein
VTIKQLLEHAEERPPKSVVRGAAGAVGRGCCFEGERGCCQNLLPIGGCVAQVVNGGLKVAAGPSKRPQDPHPLRR